MMARYTALDYLGALAHGARLLVRHRGNLTEVQADLDRDREWARFRARHGIKVDEATMRTMDPPDEATSERLRFAPAGESVFTPEQMAALRGEAPGPRVVLDITGSSQEAMVDAIRRMVKGRRPDDWPLE